MLYTFVCTAGSLDGIKDLIAETAIMKTFNHPNVLPLLGMRIDHGDEDAIKMVIPFMANGDLRNFLKNSRVSPNNTRDYPEVSIVTFTYLNVVMYNYNLISST